MLLTLKKRLWELRLPILICLLFFLGYVVLSIVRHNHYGSFGYDLGINDQVVWEYSRLLPPISTIGPNPGSLKLVNHVEVIFALLAPFYWIWTSPLTLLLLEPLFFCVSGIAIFLLAKKRNLNIYLCFAILIGYLGFYGAQNAIWFDVHSVSSGASFLAWFIYFYQEKRNKLTVLFFLLAITSKENIAFITFFISLVYFIARKDKQSFIFMLVSMAYTFFMFFVFFPHILHVPYQYQNKEGLFSNLNVTALFDTQEKVRVIFYTLTSFGYLAVLNPLTLIPMLGDLATYFVIGSDLTGAQGLFMQYRISLAPLMAWATISTIHKYKILNTKWVALYLILCTAFVQYSLHLPLSYLSKQWFWYESPSVKTINSVITNFIPQNATIVSQNNITPHLSERKSIYTLFPNTKDFIKNSPCGQKTCNWFRWAGEPEYLIIDTSKDWDIRHMLANRGDYINGLKNLEKTGVVKIYKQEGTTILYKVLKNPG